MNKVLLLNSFGFFPNFPSVSTAKVAALLKQSGTPVKSVDLNLCFWNELISPDNLALLKYRPWLGKDTKVPFPLTVTKDTYSILKENVLRNIQIALNIFKSQIDFYNHRKLNWAVNILFQAQQILFYHYGCFITNKVIFWPKLGFNINNLDEIYHLSKDVDHNPFIALFSNLLAPLINEYRPQIIGVDIAFPWEILPVLTLNILIKKHCPDIHINYTGHGFDEMNFARISHRIKNNHRLFFGFDSIFLLRNDSGLKRFYTEYPDSTINSHTIDSLAAKNKDRITISENCIESINEDSLFPDYTDLNLNEYYTPHVVLIDKTSNKCFWNKCAFCNINLFKKETMQMEPDKFYRRMVEYQSKYNVKRFFLLDEAMHPDYVSRLSDILLENKESIVWSIRTRIDDGFTRNLLNKMYRAGCRELWIGMENASPELLKVMKKSDNPKRYVEQTERIVKNCAEIGIGLHFCLLFGFPLETEKDRSINYRFFKKIKMYLQNMPFFVTFNIFNLNFGSDVYINPSKYQINSIDTSETNFNMINIPYTTSNGNDLTNAEYEKNVDTLANDLCNIFVPSQANQLLWFVMSDSPWELLYKEHYATIRKNPFQKGGGFAEKIIVALYLRLSKHPPILRLINSLSNNKVSSMKAQVYR